MNKTAFQEPDEDPPPYSEDAQNPFVNRGSTHHASKYTHSNAILSTYAEEVFPRLPSLRPAGSRSIILVLVPPDVTTLQAYRGRDAKYISEFGSEEKLIGFPSTVEPILIRLSDPESNIDTWRTPDTLRQMETLVRSDLARGGFQVVERQATDLNLASKSASWSSRTRAALNYGEACVAAGLVTVCLRTENELGLFETRRGLAIVLSIDTGATG